MHPEIPAGQRGFFDDPEFDTFPNGIEFLLGLLPMADSRSFSTDPNAGRAPLFDRGSNSIRLTVLPWTPNLALGSGTTAAGFFERSTDGKTWTQTPLGVHDGSPQRIEEIFTPGGKALLRFGASPGATP